MKTQNDELSLDMLILKKEEKNEYQRTNKRAIKMAQTSKAKKTSYNLY